MSNEALRRSTPLIFLTLSGFTFSCVSLFSNSWVVFYDSLSKKHSSIGLIPYRSDPTWFCAATWLMLLSTFFSFSKTLDTFLVCYKVHRKGFQQQFRKKFHELIVGSVMVSALQLSAFIVVAVNLRKESNISESLGYCAYLALCSIIVCIVETGYVIHFILHREFS